MSQTRIICPEHKTPLVNCGCDHPSVAKGSAASVCSAAENYFDVIIVCRIPTTIETPEQAEEMIEHIKENPDFAYEYRKTINPIFKQNAKDHE